MRKKIGECLIQAGLITEDDLRTALAEHKRTGKLIRPASRYVGPVPAPRAA